MRNKIFYCLIFIFLIFQVTNIFSQPYNIWQPVRNITHGYIDVNPTFGIKTVGFSFYFANWEFLAFERHSGSASKICLIKLDMNGQIDTMTNIINDGFTNQNPALSYDISYSGTINNALILWESNKNGRWDIYARYFSSTITSGWGNVFPIDITSMDKFSPKCIYLSGTNFAIVYGRNNKIVYKEINGQSQTITYDTVLTSNDTSICRNPNLINNNYANKKIVSYERRKTDNNYAIYYRTSSAIPVWQNADTIAYIGNNKNSIFINNNYNGIGSVYETNRNLKWNIYNTNFPTSGSNTQDTVVKSGFYNLSNFNSFFFPLITDAPISQAFTYTRKSFDSTKIMFGTNLYVNSYRDSSTIGDTSKNVKVAMNLGVKNGSYVVIWAIFNKDSLTYSNLYARKVTVIITDINKTGNCIPEKFTLFKNYPNPFNPSTNIRYDIRKDGIVTLKVFDVNGREIELLVNEYQKAGSYEIQFPNYQIDHNRLANGIYFYKMETGENVEVKKMVLIK